MFPKIKHPGAVELWVFANLIASVLLLSLCDTTGWSCWEILLIGYCTIRIFEVVIYQINVFLFDAYRLYKAGEVYKLRGYRRIVILLIHNYIELIFWFAIIYRHLPHSFTLPSGSIDSFFHTLCLSFNTMSAFGRSSAMPISSTADMLMLVQATIGLFMALLILA